MYLSFSLHQPISLVSAGILEQQQGWIHKGRVINSFELIIGIRGTLHIAQAGQAYSVNPGGMLILLPGEYHAGSKPCDRDTAFYWFHFALKKYALAEEAALFKRLLVLGSKAEPESVHDCILPLFHPFPPDDKTQLLMNQLLHVNNSKYYTKQMEDGLLQVLLVQLAQNYLDYHGLANQSGNGNRTFAELLEWIRANAAQKLTIADITAKFPYNEDYFSRMFYNRTGMRFTDYLNRLRVNKAKSHLLQTNASVKEIAYLVGFTDEKYFMKVFKRYEKVSALQYRNAFYLTHRNVK